MVIFVLYYILLQFSPKCSVQTPTFTCDKVLVGTEEISGGSTHVAMNCIHVTLSEMYFLFDSFSVIGIRTSKSYLLAFFFYQMYI